MKKPLSKDIPLNPQTLGEHIRRVRIERGLLQKDVATILEACEDTVTGWESGRSKPQKRQLNKLALFLLERTLI